MQIRAKLLQRTLGGGGKWGDFSAMVKTVVSSPGVIACGHLGGRWFDSSGRLRFVFLRNLLFFGGEVPAPQVLSFLAIFFDG